MTVTTVEFIDPGLSKFQVSSHAGRVRWIDIGDNTVTFGKKLQQEFVTINRVIDHNGCVVGDEEIREWHDVPEEKL